MGAQILYLAAICLDGIVFSLQIIFTTSLYTYFGKEDFAIKYGLVRAGPGLAVLGFSFLMKYVNFFDSWSVVFHSQTVLCLLGVIVTLGLQKR